jgi:hypothetical protein
MNNVMFVTIGALATAAVGSVLLSLPPWSHWTAKQAIGHASDWDRYGPPKEYVSAPPPTAPIAAPAPPPTDLGERPKPPSPPRPAIPSHDELYGDIKQSIFSSGYECLRVTGYMNDSLSRTIACETSSGHSSYRVVTSRDGVTSIQKIVIRR